VASVSASLNGFLANKTFHPFSDFLLHDMGSLGDGITSGTAGPKQMRTAPLWGIRGKSRFLRGGRAETVQDAIGLHDGQGAAARDAFDGPSVAVYYARAAADADRHDAGMHPGPRAGGRGRRGGRVRGSFGGDHHRPAARRLLRGGATGRSAGARIRGSRPGRCPLASPTGGKAARSTVSAVGQSATVAARGVPWCLGHLPAVRGIRRGKAHTLWHIGC
jgi:hypothetical protein